MQSPAQIPNYKSQITNNLQYLNDPNLLDFFVSNIGIYLLFGLPARSRFGEGRCLRFGASYLT